MTTAICLLCDKTSWTTVVACCHTCSVCSYPPIFKCYNCNRYICNRHSKIISRSEAMKRDGLTD